MNRRHSTALVILLLSVAAYLGTCATYDWIPHDDGSLAHSAERLLQGELPHRDFDELYTGGLSHYHAMAFQLLGHRLISLRIALLATALVFTATVYYVISHLAGPRNCAWLTACCVMWSVPNYFASMPGWYNLFLAVGGAAALLRFVDTGHMRWVFLAGVCGGLSILVKIVGLYYVAAALLFLVHWNQTTPSPRRQTACGRLYLPCVAAALVLFVVSLVVLVSRRASVMDYLHFVVPAALLTAFVLALEWRRRKHADGLRWKRLLSTTTALMLGTGLPIVAFLVPYLESSAIPRLVHGLFVSPQVRFQLGTLPMPPPLSLVAAVPLAALLAAAIWWQRWPSKRWVVGVVGGVLWGAAAVGYFPEAYRLVWYSLRPTVPLVVVTGCCVLLMPVHLRKSRRDERQKLFLLLAVASMISLVQFPFAAGIYFCYSAPAVIIAGVFASRHFAELPKRLLSCLLAAYCLFALLWLHHGRTYHLGVQYVPLQSTRVDLGRAGIRIAASDAQLYEDLVEEIRKHTKQGDYIYATPDSPEVYFLADRRNPTRTFFDIFDPDFSDPVTRTERILKRLEQYHVKVVVIRRQVEFTQALPEELLAELERRYPQRVMSPLFAVFYRQTPQGK